MKLWMHWLRSHAVGERSEEVRKIKLITYCGSEIKTVYLHSKLSWFLQIRKFQDIYFFLQWIVLPEIKKRLIRTQQDLLHFESVGDRHFSLSFTVVVSACACVHHHHQRFVLWRPYLRGKCMCVYVCACMHVCLTCVPLLSTVILPASGFDKDQQCGGKWINSCLCFVCLLVQVCFAPVCFHRCLEHDVCFHASNVSFMLVYHPVLTS